MHALVAIPFIVIAVFALIGIDTLVRLLYQQIVDRSGPRWPVPTALVLTTAAIFFFVSWLHQLR